MALIRRSAASLAALADRGSVLELMFEQTLYGSGPRPSPGEARSWSRSIPVLAHDLVEAGLGNVEVLLEHRLPLTSRRVDAILAGWVRLLGLVPGGPIDWIGDPAFNVRVSDTPQEMEHLLRTKLDAGYGARIAAGYCWPWSDPRPDGSLEADMVIGSWARPWNLKGERAIGGAPPSALWATDPAGFGQVGCVYTAQGFEYDWNGVIIGPDLVWRRSDWAVIRSANKDPDFRSQTKVTEIEFGRLIRNVYKVLLTRGMVGTVIYSPDPETRDLLRTLIS